MGRALLLSLIAAGVLAASASASVRRVSFTATATPGDDVALTIAVSPAARCTITVTYDTVVSHAKGLNAKTGKTITWRWRVGTSTHPGRWPVSVDCGHSGKLTLKLRVT